MSRPRFKPTSAQRDLVKLLKADGWPNERIATYFGIARNTLETTFAPEIEFGADFKRAKLLEWMQAAARKGSVAAGRWLAARFDAVAAAAAIEKKQPKLGKKERQQEAAQKVKGKFAPPAPPKFVH